jgi:hypothetical protein
VTAVLDYGYRRGRGRLSTNSWIEERSGRISRGKTQRSALIEMRIDAKSDKTIAPGLPLV